MKKTIALLMLVLISIFTFTACDANMGKFFVNFDKQDGSDITMQSQWVRLNESGFVYKPDDPIREDYVFEGWYKEPTCENKWDFDKDTLKGDDNITLYAKWTAKNPVISPGFYRLQEAYDLGILKYEDLFEASYHNGDWRGVPNGIPISRSAYLKNPELLSTETENKIKQTFLNDYYANIGGCIVLDDYAADVLEYTLDEITISNYCGTYIGAVVVYLEGLYPYTEAEWSETIAGITFYYHNGNYLRVWGEQESQDLRSLAGVKMTTEKSTYHLDVETILVTWENNTNKNLLFGESFILEKKNNWKWHKIQSEDISFISIGYDVLPESNRNHTYNIKDIYNNLKPGEYRISTHFYDCADIPVTADDAYWLYAEFTLSDDASTLASKGHFFMTGFGGGLVNFPFDAFISGDKYNEEYPMYHYDSTIVSMTCKAQVNIFNGTYSQSYSQEENWWIKDNRFSDLINSYDESFFQDKQIITFFVTASSGGYHFEISNVIYDNGVLTIEISQTSKGVGHCALVDWFSIVEVEKILTNTEIVISIQNRGW